MSNNDPNNPEVIEIVQESSRGINRWSPIVGSETLALLRQLALPSESQDRLREESVSILSKCVSPVTNGETSTGLIIGYVQSGKTMSFTTVTALAHDNRYHLVIIIAGISLPLFNQSTERLEMDLQLTSRSNRKWRHFPNPKRNSDRSHIVNALEDCNDYRIPEPERQSVLITVMKHHTHLRNLFDLLSSIDLRSIPAIIIDDEADQASLNTLVRSGDQSTTYRQILRLRNCLQHHTFLQYTATPQAPLLINIIDILSPTFVELLTPGSAYTGGKEFFLENRSLIRSIPVNDIPTRDNALLSPPDSLLYAMRVFFLGVAAGLLLDHGNGNRSMMVHPSQKRNSHRQYFQWVNRVREQWQDILQLNSDEPDYQDLIRDFQSAYQDLAGTADNIPSFDTLCNDNYLLRAIRGTSIVEINARQGKTPNISWASYAYLLVGGQAMDRGFTVEGLTVTYMPRDLGGGNADTTQQRARFFGYKRSYLGYCRVFLEGTALTAYTNYLRHEENIREQLIPYRDSNSPLSDWRRAFFLTTDMRPTRRSVLGLDYMRGNRNEWYISKAPHDSLEAIETNRNLVEQFISTLQTTEDPGHQERPLFQKHLMASSVPLRLVYEQLLTPLRFTRPTDSQQFTMLRILLQNHLEQHPRATCTIYIMSKGVVRKRRVNSNDEILNLFQGAHPSTGANQGSIYPGDREIKAPHGITIQIHKLQLVNNDDSQILADNVPALAIIAPGELFNDWIVQDQGGLQ